MRRRPTFLFSSQYREFRTAECANSNCVCKHTKEARRFDSRQLLFFWYTIDRFSILIATIHIHPSTAILLFMLILSLTLNVGCSEN